MRSILTFLTVAAAIAPGVIFANEAPVRPKVVAYVPNWIDLGAFAKTIPFAKLTHINVAFENPVDDAGNLSFHPGDRVLLEKAKAAGVKVLVSIGGGGAAGDKELQSRYFKLIAADKRAGFITTISAYLDEHAFDGIDIDIEGPSINQDYGDFIAGLAAELKPKGKLLTAALSQGYGGKQVPDSALADFDFINIMAYDATGTWDKNRPGQHSSLAFAKAQVDYWLGRGLPPAKAVLGVPFYGYGFAESWRNYSYSYRQIVAADPVAALYDETACTIYYNGMPTIRSKARLVLDRKLGGVMIWSLDNDAAGELSLLSALDSVLRPQPAQ